ncbi:MAG: nucleotide sugar dehydrogenase, partial [Bacteroidales bacterium]|nr:nucleotide sugar dehydrogenase [Bacteroidales bacterium]
HAIILAVAHQAFLSLDLGALKKEETVLYDVKGILDLSLVDGRL